MYSTERTEELYIKYDDRNGEGKEYFRLRDLQPINGCVSFDINGYLYDGVFTVTVYDCFELDDNGLWAEVNSKEIYTKYFNDHAEALIIAELDHRGHGCHEVIS